MHKIFAIFIIALSLIGCSAPSSQGVRVEPASVYDTYNRAWTMPTNALPPEIRVRALVVVARDGRVLSSRIVEPSWDLQVDKSVQKALDKVHQIQPFSPGTTNEQQNYYIDFKLRTKK